jgi:hypothetical protein
MNEDQLTGWLVGLFDGEGSIVIEEITRDGSGFNVKVNISNSNRELLVTIKERLGYGFLSKVSNGAARWSCSHDNAKRFLERVQPFVIVKRQKVEIALALLNTVTTGINKLSPEVIILRERYLEAWRLTKVKRDLSAVSAP